MAIAVAGLGLSLIMSLAWAFQRARGNAGWVDVFWTFGTGAVGASLAWLQGGGRAEARPALVAAMAAFWSLRLGIHLFKRVSSGPEDVRYAAFRTQWGERFQSRLFWFLQIQAAAALILVAGMYLAAGNPVSALGINDIAGLLVLSIAVLGEGVADAQLRRFKANPANHGKVCDAGLWAWSRHPNYFFEWLVWVAFALVATDPSGAHPIGLLAWAAPAFMLWLLVRVSGIPPLEAQMIKSRGEAYRDYQARTSAFIPLPPRRLGSAGTLGKQHS